MVLMRGQTAMEMVLILSFIVLAATIAIVMSAGVVSGTANSVSNITIIPN